MPSEEAFGDAAFMFRLGNPQEVDWKMEGIEIQYDKNPKWWYTIMGTTPNHNNF